MTPNRSPWREVLAPFAVPCLRRGMLAVATSALPYLALCVLMYLTLSVSPLLTLALAIPTAGFLVRVFVVFHDCAHGSLLPSKRANNVVGSVLGLLRAVAVSPLAPRPRRPSRDVGRPRPARRRRRRSRSPSPSTRRARAAGRLGYRLIRNPLVMFGFGPVIAMVIGPRIVARGARRRMRNSVLGTDVGARR